MFAEYARALFDNGWRNIIPLTHDKGTRVKWGPLQHKEMTERTLQHFCEHYGSAPRAGLVFGPEREFAAIDIDVTDRAESLVVREVAKQTLPETEYQRVGRAPKIAFYYRGTVLSAKPYRLDVEVFGSSGQMAVFGTHPGTGKPYHWPRRSLLEVRPCELPKITQAQVDAFIEGVRRVLKRDCAGGPDAGCDLDEAFRIERQMHGLSAARRQLMSVASGDRHFTLRSVTGWMVAKGYDADTIAAFVDEHFPASLRSEGFRDVAGYAAKLARGAHAKFFGAQKDWSL